MSPLLHGHQKMTQWNRFKDLGKSETFLREEFARAFKERLVTFSVSRRSKPPRHGDLQEKLLKAFEARRLATAIVIDSGKDGMLPSRLGLAGAHHLADDRLRSDDVMGVGAGQTVGWLSRHFRELRSSRATNVTFVSLSGIFCAGQRRGSTASPATPLEEFAAWLQGDIASNVLIDADINSIRMAQGVEAHVNFKLIGVPAVVPKNQNPRGRPAAHVARRAARQVEPGPGRCGRPSR